jgi:mRNA-degrading endonuclease toxin of MazEF toxin-antitoxin module
MKKGELWRVHIPALGGRSQQGIRPGIVLADPQLPVVVIIPCTSNLEALRFRFTVRMNPSTKNGLETASVALGFQLLAVDRQFFEKKIGTLEKPLMDELNRSVKQLLSI